MNEREWVRGLSFFGFLRKEILLKLKASQAKEIYQVLHIKKGKKEGDSST